MPFDGIMNYGHESFDAVTTASKTSWSSSVDDFDALMVTKTSLPTCVVNWIKTRLIICVCLLTKLSAN